MSDEKQVNFEVDADAYDQAKRKLEWGGISRVLRERVHEVAYGTETTERKRLKEKLEQLRKEKREVENEIDDLRHDRDEKEREISRVEDRLDTLIDQEGEYDGFLQSLESDLHEGKRFFEGHGKIESAADLGDCTTEEVILDLKERNPDIPDRAFREPKQSEPGKWKQDIDRI